MVGAPSRAEGPDRPRRVADIDTVATAASVHGILRRLSDEAGPKERDALRRAAGLAGRTADEVVRGTAIELARSAAREALE